jgi:hypothetical protein
VNSRTVNSTAPVPSLHTRFIPTRTRPSGSLSSRFTAKGGREVGGWHAVGRFSAVARQKRGGTAHAEARTPRPDASAASSPKS